MLSIVGYLLGLWLQIKKEEKEEAEKIRKKSKRLEGVLGDSSYHVGSDVLPEPKFQIKRGDPFRMRERRVIFFKFS